MFFNLLLILILNYLKTYYLIKNVTILYIVIFYINIKKLNKIFFQIILLFLYIDIYINKLNFINYYYINNYI